MSQEQEKMAKILSPKKPRNAKRKSTESNLTRKVLNGKPGKGEKLSNKMEIKSEAATI